MYAPILPFMTEELYQDLFVGREESISIHLSSWPNQIGLKNQADISDFDQVIQAIGEIRGYKSQYGLPLGTELDSYQLKTKVDIKKYGDFIKNAIRVKKLSN
jgi:valyl-tRNA synthetase